MRFSHDLASALADQQFKRCVVNVPLHAGLPRLHRDAVQSDQRRALVLAGGRDEVTAFAREMLAGSLLSIHNIHMLIDLTHDLQQAIQIGSAADFAENFRSGYQKHRPEGT